MSTKRKRHTPEQEVRNFTEADRLLAQGADTAEMASQLGVSEQTCFRWRNHFGGLKADVAKRLKKLERKARGSSGPQTLRPAPTGPLTGDRTVFDHSPPSVRHGRTHRGRLRLSELDGRLDHRNPGHRRQPRNGSGENPTTRADHPDCFAPRPQSIIPIYEVIQRPQK
jgi:hypothetical protein